MEKKELCAEEGLFISDFTDAFFEKRLEDEEGLEEFIRECAGKAEALSQQREGIVWHSIMKVAVEEACKIGLKNYFDFAEEPREHSELEQIMLDFYGEPFFLELDVAQKITYNLYRLDGVDKYDIEDDGDVEDFEKGYGKLLDLGRKMKEKDLAVDLLPGLDRIREKYEKTGHKPKVCLQGGMEGSQVNLEANFAGLNVLYIGNEKFRGYLDWKERVKREMPKDAPFEKGNVTKVFQMLLGNIEILNAEKDVPLQYIWEKMTDFNAMGIVAKFLLALMEKGGLKKKDVREFMENVANENYFLFRKIAEMPNILTRLLFLKQAFRHMADRTDELAENFKKLKISLGEMNKRYECIQQVVLEVAVLVRWYMDRGKRLNKRQWLKELDREYPVSLFEELLLSVSLEDDLRKMEDMELSEEKMEQERNRCLLLEWSRGRMGFPEGMMFVEKCRLLECMKENRHYDEGRSFMGQLQKEGWITSKSYFEFMEKKYKDACERIPFGQICTAIYHEYEKGHNETCEENVENLWKKVSLCLLSEYKNVIFENTHTDQDIMYEEIFNLLLYHTWK